MSIVRDVAGLVVEDDFDRADSSTIGGDWVERSGNWEIADNRLRAPSGSAWIDHDVAVDGGFVQCVSRVSASSSSFGIGLRADYDGGSPDGYMAIVVAFDDVIRLYRISNGSFTQIAEESVTIDLDTDYVIQFDVANGVQRAWVNGVTVSASDTTYDDVSGVLAFRKTGTDTAVVTDDVVRAPVPTIIVEGLPTGYKAKVRNSGGTVVAQATESGGTATINVSLYQEAQSAGTGATEVVPIGGWTDLIVTDGDDNIIETYDATGVYPGDEYTFVLEAALDAQPGAVELTGSPATLTVARTLSAQPGALTLTGQAAGLARDRSLAAEAGAVQVTGQPAGLTAARILQALAGAIEITGEAAELTHTVGASLDAQPGAIDITGSPATFLHVRAYLLDAEPGAIELSGIDAALTYSAGVTLQAEPGAIELTGIAAALTNNVPIVLEAEPGAIVITGIGATLTGPEVVEGELVIDGVAYPVLAFRIPAEDRDAQTSAQDGTWRSTQKGAGVRPRVIQARVGPLPTADRDALINSSLTSPGAIHFRGTLLGEMVVAVLRSEIGFQPTHVLADEWSVSFEAEEIPS